MFLILNISQKVRNGLSFYTKHSTILCVLANDSSVLITSALHMLLQVITELGSLRTAGALITLQAPCALHTFVDNRAISQLVLYA